MQISLKVQSKPLESPRTKFCSALQAPVPTVLHIYDIFRWPVPQVMDCANSVLAGSKIQSQRRPIEALISILIHRHPISYPISYILEALKSKPKVAVVRISPSPISIQAQAYPSLPFSALFHCHDQPVRLLLAVFQPNPMQSPIKSLLEVFPADRGAIYLQISFSKRFSGIWRLLELRVAQHFLSKSAGILSDQRAG